MVILVISARGDKRSQSILDAAARLFSVNGYDGTTVVDIAAAVGLTGAAIYKHFDSKQALLVAMVREMVAHWEHEAIHAAAAAKDGREAVEQLCRISLRVALDRSDVVMLWHAEARKQFTPEIGQELAASRARIVAIWVQQVVIAQPQLTKAEANLRVRLALMLLNGIPRTRELPEVSVEATLFRMMMATIGAPSSQHQPLHRSTSLIGDGAGTRFEILRCSAELFQRDGYHAVAMGDIGAAVGIAGPSIYKHFASKAAILEELVEIVTSALSDAAATTIVSAAEPADALNGLVTDFGTWSLEGDPLMTVFMLEYAMLPEDVLSQHMAERRKFNRLWVKAVQTRYVGTDAVDAAIMALAVMELLFAASRSEHVKREPAELGHVLGLAFEALESAKQPVGA